MEKDIVKAKDIRGMRNICDKWGVSPPPNFLTFHSDVSVDTNEEATDYEVTVTDEESNVVLNVYKCKIRGAELNLTVTGLDEGFSLGQNSTILCSVTDSEDELIEGVSIQIYVDNTLQGTGVTASDGEYEFVWNPSYVGVVSIEIRIEPQTVDHERYTSAIFTQNVIVNGGTVLNLVTSSSFNSSSNQYSQVFTVALADANDNILKNQEVNIVDNQGTVIANGITNDNGVFSVSENYSLANIPIGSFHAEYDGDNSIGAMSSISNNVEYVNVGFRNARVTDEIVSVEVINQNNGLLPSIPVKVTVDNVTLNLTSGNNGVISFNYTSLFNQGFIGKMTPIICTKLFSSVSNDTTVYVCKNPLTSSSLDLREPTVLELSHGTGNCPSGVTVPGGCYYDYFTLRTARGAPLANKTIKWRRV